VALFFTCICLYFVSIWLFKQIENLGSDNKKLLNFTNRLDRYRALGLLASGVCHEMGTPLNTIRLDTDRLLDKLKDKDQDDYSDIESIERNVDKCISSLRKLNLHVHDQENHFFKEPFYLLPVVTSFIEEIKENFNLEINSDLLIPVTLGVTLPKILFLRSLLDLVENAQQAGATTISIQISNLDNTEALIKVLDNGCGFKKELFESFGNPFVTSKDTGSGLGLYHLKNLLGIIGGELKISNREERGACVELIVPCAIN
jgi:signal transduction histidine kinase